ncbi:chemotaxis protein CheW [Spirulina subsalsa FACHB-351]|uniref:Chemotaxis protein CheW n=1 Tax=Spirulina subsalsa FACHB-351 TaxID=234711 RepID=A0ABT3L9L1_9CYAN|nr:chemotaxis protein CheW [Spirulina subsalsa]MCW6038179.1 chemotaxis protein CheW [Spirulina subsalsa FACHB-351]
MTDFKRRFQAKKQQTPIPTQKVLVFSLGPEQYAIAIEQVLRIVTDFTPHGQLHNGHSLVKYQEDVITLLNLQENFPQIPPLTSTPYLMICYNPHSQTTPDYIGIPLTEMPKVLDIPLPQFAPLPPSYDTQQELKGIEQVIYPEQGGIIFYRKFWV